MGKIFKNLIPFWHMVIFIIIFLCVQAFCDLSLPSYTSDIIDTGIQNKGVEYVMPEKITSKEYEYIRVFMTEKEKKVWEKSYKPDGDYYVRTLEKKKELKENNELFSVAFLMDGQMSVMEEEMFLTMLAQQSGKDASEFASLSLEDAVAMTKMELPINEVEKEDKDGKKQTVKTVDVRPMYLMMSEKGMLTEDSLKQIRGKVSKMIETMGDSLVESSAIAHTITLEDNAGVDMNKKQTDYLWISGAKMIGLALLMGLATVIVGFFGAKVGAGVGRNLRKTMFEKVVRFSNAEMDKFSTASLITRTTNDVQQIQMVTGLMLRMVAYAPILGVGGIFKVYNTGAGMGWVIGLAVLVLFGFVGVLMSVAMPKFKKMQELVDRVNLVSREILTGLSVIRAFGRDQKEEERFDEANKALTKTMLFTNRVMTFMMPGMMLVMYGLTIMIVWVAAHKIDAGVMEVGSMTAFITYSIQIVMSFLMLTVLSIMLPRAAVASNRIAEVEKTELTIKEAKEPKNVTNAEGVVAFHKVCFRYPGAEEDVLSDIDFVAEPGKTTAIIGSTGCGKSTLINLIPRLYDVTEGSVTLDGVDIRELAMSDLREEIGLVPQKGVLFSGTIASNVRFGNKEATDEEMREAASIAQATEFIEKKEDKYDSAISQGGSNVSGGQKQRLAIARAIAKKSKVYIFDDSFSALDLKTDAAVRKALEQKVKDATVIIVAQRISTILHADQILVLEDGRIVGKGTHEELLKNCDVYLQIAKSQLSEKELGLEGKEENGNE